MIREESSHARIVDRFCLNKEGGPRETWHVVVEAENTFPPFFPGDSIGVFPKNQAKVVEELIQYFGVSRDTIVIDRKGRNYPLSDWLREHVEIHKITHTVFDAVVKHAVSWQDKNRLEALNIQQKEKIIAEYELFHFLQEYAGGGVAFHDIVTHLPPLRPRLYSIASGPSLGNKRLELLVARVAYECNGKVRRGVCSHYLIEEALLHADKVLFFHQPSRNFVFPKENTPLIMVGAGTGIAPFRAFMHEVEQKVFRPSACWLFFGEQKSSRDFFYEDFWKRHVEETGLRLHLAFSQDQEHKIYVQHRMWEERRHLWQWLQEGAHVLVCGHAQKMAKDVEQCLLDIAQAEGAMKDEQSKEWLKALRAEKRYMKDVY
jgi:sulfite reductase (NADPH) flavoprotein alpha-component